MKKLLIVTIAIFAFICLSVQETRLVHLSTSADEKEGELYQTVSKKTGKFKKPTNFTLSFEFNFDDRNYSYVDFTTPFDHEDIKVVATGITTGFKRVKQKFEIYNATEFQIDAKAYVQPVKKRARQTKPKLFDN